MPWFGLNFRTLQLDTNQNGRGETSHSPWSQPSNQTMVHVKGCVLKLFCRFLRG